MLELTTQWLIQHPNTLLIIVFGIVLCSIYLTRTIISVKDMQRKLGLAPPSSEAEAAAVVVAKSDLERVLGKFQAELFQNMEQRFMPRAECKLIHCESLRRLDNLEAGA